MRKHLGWISIGIVVFTFLTVKLLPFNGFWGTNYMLAGLVLALVCSIISLKNTGKIIALTLLTSLLVLFIFSVIGFLALA